MSSPLSSFQEFSEADGAIYTFANNPTTIGFLLVICLAITVYFLYASYTMKQSRPDNSARAIGLLLVAGAASLFSLINPPKQPQASDRPQPQRSTTATNTTAKTLQPLALLGMVGIGRSRLGRERRRKSRR